jgi:hypothetical protein
MTRQQLAGPGSFLGECFDHVWMLVQASEMGFHLTSSSDASTRSTEIKRVSHITAAGPYLIYIQFRRGGRVQQV